LPYVNTTELALYLPFNSVGDDRVYSAEDIADLFAAVMTNGIHPSPGDSLFVSTAGGWNVQVAPGRCVINGRFGFSTTSITLPIDVPTGAARIDSIILRCDFINRLIGLHVLKGEEGTNPAPANMQRDGEAYELCLAQITILPSKPELDQAIIKDTRHDPAVCGIATSLIQVDPTSLLAQYEQVIADWLYSAQTDIDGDTGANLALRIEYVAERLERLAAKAEPGRIAFADITIPVSAWEADGTYTTLAVKAAVPLPNVLARMYPEVIYNPDAMKYARLGPVAKAYDGGVYVYAAVTPSDPVNISAIYIWDEKGTMLPVPAQLGG